MRKIRLLGLLLIGLLVIAGTASAHPLVGGRPITASMTGTQEVPPGDPDATGQASFTFNPGQGEICYDIQVQNITLPARAAHIHVAPVGVAGPIVVPLTAPDASGHSSGCVTGVDRELVKAILMHPENYYVNVHTSDYPSGAVRGQLSK